MKENSRYLRIAGLKIALHSDLKIALDVGYKNFIDKSNDPADIEVECKAISENPIPAEAEKIFSSADEELHFYDIYRQGEILWFLIHDQYEQERVQQYARLEADLRSWTIWAHETEGRIAPMHFPMGPVLFHYATLTIDAVMMHASAIFDGEMGRMFSGFSGAGKSTMAGIWEKEGSKIVNDDRIIIRKEGEQFFVYNTPMYYEDENKKYPLDAVYLIRHAPENDIEAIRGVAAASGVMAFSIQNNYDKRFVAHHLDFFTQLASGVKVYRLGVVPTREIIDFVKQHD